MPTNTPGVNLLTIGSVTSQQPPASTDTAFIVDVTAQGRTDKPVLITSMNQFIMNFGPRVSWSYAYDWCDAFFNEANGGQIYVMRVVGASATLDSVTFNDSGASPAITINSIGAAASGLSAAIVSGVAASSYNIVITGLPDGSTLQSPDLFTETDAVNWSLNTTLIRVVAAGTNAPANHAAQALTGGADNHSAVTDSLRVAALALIPWGLGPGQVAIPGHTTEAVYAGLLNHAFTNNRFALLDAVDTASQSTLTTAAAAAQADTNVSSGALGAGMFIADWQIIPGIVPGTTRTVPPSAIVAALIATSDRSQNPSNPNLAAAGPNGIASYALGKTQVDWTDAQTTALVAAGINPFRYMFNTERLFGFRTLLNPANNPVLIMANAVRLLMAIKYNGYLIGQQQLFAQIDGNGHRAQIYANMVSGMLLDYYQIGALYGATSAQAYSVDAGADVNTPASVAGRNLIVAVGVVPAPDAETVFFEVASYNVTQTV
jgi:hypothetical protein